MKPWQESMLLCIGIPVACGLLGLLGPIGGIIGIVVFLWVVFSGAGSGEGDGGPWDGFGRP